MRDIIGVDPEEAERKCPMCRFRVNSLYRFEDEIEDHAVCSDCFIQHALEDGIRVADEDELLIAAAVNELVNTALAELSAGELDSLEDTLRSIDDEIPTPENGTPPAEA